MCDKHTKSILNLYFKDAFFLSYRYVQRTRFPRIHSSHSWKFVPIHQHHRSLSLSSPMPKHWRMLVYSLLPCIWLLCFCNWHASEVVYSSFCVWLILLSIISSKFIANGRISFSVKAENHSVVHAHNDSFIDSSTNRHLPPPLLGYCKLYCNEHRNGGFSLMNWYHFLGL